MTVFDVHCADCDLNLGVGSELSPLDVSNGCPACLSAYFKTAPRIEVVVDGVLRVTPNFGWPL